MSARTGVRHRSVEEDPERVKATHRLKMWVTDGELVDQKSR